MREKNITKCCSFEPNLLTFPDPQSCFCMPCMFLIETFILFIASLFKTKKLKKKCVEDTQPIIIFMSKLWTNIIKMCHTLIFNCSIHAPIVVVLPGFRC